MYIDVCTSFGVGLLLLVVQEHEAQYQGKQCWSLERELKQVGDKKERVTMRECVLVIEFLCSFVVVVESALGVSIAWA